MWGEPIGWRQHAPKGCFFFFWRGEGLNSHQVPLVPIKYPSKSFCSHKFLNSSYQIPLVLVSNPSKSFVPIKFSIFSSTSHQLPINFPLTSSCSHQYPIKILLFSSSSHCSHQFPINFILFPTQPYINPHKALTFGTKSFYLVTWKLGSWDDSTMRKMKKMRPEWTSTHQCTIPKIPFWDFMDGMKLSPRGQFTWSLFIFFTARFFFPSSVFFFFSGNSSFITFYWP